MMEDIEEITENRIQAAEAAISTHRDVISSMAFTDDDPAKNLSQLLNSLEIFAKRMGINFEAALAGDDDKLWELEQEEIPSGPVR